MNTLQILQGQLWGIQLLILFLKAESDTLFFMWHGVISHILGPKHLNVSNPYLTFLGLDWL